MYNKLWLQLTLINVLKKGKRNLIHINHKNQRINTNTEKNYQQTEKCFYALNQFSKDKKVNKSIEVEIFISNPNKRGDNHACKEIKDSERFPIKLPLSSFTRSWVWLCKYCG